MNLEQNQFWAVSKKNFDDTSTFITTAKNNKVRKSFPYICIPAAENKKTYDPLESQHYIHYDIGGKANGERKNYMLKCSYCDSIYKFNSHNPMSHVYSIKCFRARGLSAGDNERGDWWHSVLDDISECRGHGGKLMGFMKEKLGQEIIQIFYTIQKNKRRVTYDKVRKEIMKIKRQQEALLKISNWFLHIKYSPHYKYGRKYINDLYNEIAAGE